MRAHVRPVGLVTLSRLTHREKLATCAHATHHTTTTTEHSEEEEEEEEEEHDEYRFHLAIGQFGIYVGET